MKICAHVDVGLGLVAASPPPFAARSLRAANACRKAIEGVGEAGVSFSMSFARDPANATEPSIEAGRAITAAGGGLGIGGTVTVDGTNEASERLRLCRESMASEPTHDRRVGLGTRLGAAEGIASDG